jgi:ParB/RepB/Spo0J family partition protein
MKINEVQGSLLNAPEDFSVEDSSSTSVLDNTESLKTESSGALPSEPGEEELVVLLDPKKCVVSKANGRFGVAFDPAKSAELLADIRRQGQKTPVIVRRTSDGGYELVAGTRRLGAILELRKHQPELKIRAYLRTLSDEEAWQIADAENAGRRDLTTLQRARSWNYAIQNFHSGRQDLFAKAIGKDPSVISRTIALLDLPDEVLSALRDPEGVSVNFAAKLAPALADSAKRDRIVAIAANVVEAGGPLSSPELLKRLLLSPAEIAATNAVIIEMGDCERQAAFSRTEKGGATLTIRPVSSSTDEKTRRAFLRQMEKQLRTFLQL